jgi:hypothetical protein
MYCYIILWVTCCIILHNLIIRLEESNEIFDPNEWYQPEEESDDGHMENGDGAKEPVTDGVLF